MKTQLGFINIALLLLFLFGISSCSALQIGRDIKTQLFQENGNVLTYEYDALNRVRASIDGNKNRT